MMLFLAVLTIGFIYEWKKGALNGSNRPRTAAPIGPGPEQDAILKAVGDEITNRACIASADKFFNCRSVRCGR